MKTLIDENLKAADTNTKDYQKLIFKIENARMEKDGLKFNLNLKFYITWVLWLNFDRLSAEDKEWKYLVAPDLEMFAFPESIEEVFYEDSKRKWLNLSDDQVALFNI